MAEGDFWGISNLFGIKLFPDPAVILDYRSIGNIIAIPVLFHLNSLLHLKPSGILYMELTV